MAAGTQEMVRARPQRFTGLLPHRLLRWRRPLWWQEVLIILLGYWLYSLGRNAVPEQAAMAERHGRSIQHLEDTLHLNWEVSINHWVAHTDWAAQAMDYYYATLHFLVTPAVLVWLFIRRPHFYRGVRTVLFATSIVALIGFYLYPTAPPRLLHEFGYIDTVILFKTWGSLADPNIASHSNQYAAMPSLHIAWAVWCGVVIVVCARRLWVKMLGVVYPFATLTVIVMIGFGIQYLLSGHGAFVAPVDAPDYGRPDPPLPHMHMPHHTPGP
jgi:hypothetical protein